MKILLISLSVVVAAFLAGTCSAVAFERRATSCLFGIPRGGGKKETDADEREDDYEAAERRIFEAEKNAIERVEKAIEDEVETFYHEMPHHEKKENISKGSSLKKTVAAAERDEGSEKHDDYEVAEDKIFKAVENAEKKVLSVAHKAEKAVEHAIEDEVKAMFPNQHEDS
jgi:glutamyl-tRNA reductase